VTKEELIFEAIKYDRAYRKRNEEPLPPDFMYEYGHIQMQIRNRKLMFQFYWVYSKLYPEDIQKFYG
jgi:hypothetical protein